ncbi:OstA family protein [Pleurocapsales cyanobacterium LEGE 06147]|nr:OstA family protein [Pleurocapsales cyanobacterium LEGE 06147]
MTAARPAHSTSPTQIIRILATLVGAIAFLALPPFAGAQNLTPKDAITLRSDIQEANTETGVIVARGNVQINYPARQIQATAAQAQYFSRERRILLSGDVYVLQQGNSMRAETMVYLIDEGRFVAEPKANRQVESTYILSEPTPTNN